MDKVQLLEKRGLGRDYRCIEMVIMLWNTRAGGEMRMHAIGRGERRRDSMYMQGSFTVEAAFVVPMVLGLVFIIWYMIFLLHDRVLLQGNVNKIAYLYANGRITREEAVKRDRMADGMWMVTVKEITVKKGVQKVECKAVAEGNMTIPVISYFVDARELLQAKAVFLHVQPEEILELKRQKE